MQGFLRANRVVAMLVGFFWTRGVGEESHCDWRNKRDSETRTMCVVVTG